MHPKTMKRWCGKKPNSCIPRSTGPRLHIAQSRTTNLKKYRVGGAFVFNEPKVVSRHTYKSKVHEPKQQFLTTPCRGREELREGNFGSAERQKVNRIMCN